MMKYALIVAVLAAGSAARGADAPDTSTWAQFSGFHYSGTMKTSAGAGEYLNPIIAGFHPDPSMLRVGNDYYLVNSAFNYFPSVPIFHSTDLVNWTQIGNVIDRPSQFPMRGGQMSQGTYAPVIRFHEGTYYMVNTLVGSALGNYYVTAKDPKGPWSDPIKLDGVGGIDPSFFFDDDGKCYVCSCDDPEQSLYNGHRAIKLQELDLEQKHVVGEKTVIINGGTDISKRPVWCEGPHIYKINGKYFAMCAQGGTSTAHTEVIFKSDTLRGTYVPWDQNPILTQMDLRNGRPDAVTCSGHADLVQTQNGEWYAVFLGCQPYDASDRYFNTGRETFLLPVSWTADNWPVILPPHTTVPLSVKKPNLPAGAPGPVATTGNIDYTDNFDGDALDFRWVQIRAPQSQWYATSKQARSLFLEPRDVTLSARGNPSCLLTRQQNNDFSATVTLTAQPTTADCTAGLTAFMEDNHYYAIDVKIDGGHLTEVSLEQPAAGGGRGGFGRRGRGGGPGGASLAPATAPASAPATPARPTDQLPANTTRVDLKIEGAGAVMRLYYKIGNGPFTQIGKDLDSTFLSTETAGGFQGVMLGMFAHN